MTLEELQAAANNGDIDAMISLGEQCLEGRTLNACKDALNWFDMAAQKDSAYAAAKASAICALIAETYMSNGALGQETFGFWQKTILHALGAMKDPDDPDFEENSDLLWKLLDKGFLGVACLQYMNEQAAAALETLKRIDPPNTPELINAAKLLKVVCMVDAVGDSAINEIISVFNSVFSDKEYVATISDTSVLEQLIFACAANIYGVMLRKGIGTPVNPQLADAVLDYAYNALSEDVAKKGLRPQS
jgi:hypothetical protein